MTFSCAHRIFPINITWVDLFALASTITSVARVSFAGNSLDVSLYGRKLGFANDESTAES